MRQVLTSGLRSFGGDRWLCRVPLTCADVTRLHGVAFVPDDGLPGTVLAVVEVEGLLLLLTAVPESIAPMTFVVVHAWDDVRSPRQALEAALRALGCTLDGLESLNDDLQPWPWALTCNDGHGGRRVASFVRDGDIAARRCDWLRRCYPHDDFRLEPA